MSKVYVFNLPNIFCAACVQPIKNALANYKAVKIEYWAEDTIEKNIAIFVSDDEQQSDQEVKKKLLELITSLGIDAEYDNSILKYLIKGITGVLTGFTIMALMMSGIMIPSLVMYLLMGGSTALTLYLGAESYHEAFKNLTKTKTLTMDSLFTISTISVLCVSLASLFIPNLPMMIDAGLMIFGFRLLGRAIEESIKQHMVSGLKFRNRISPLVEKIKNLEHDEKEEVTVSEIQKDDIIIVHSGEVIPVDGYCLDETSSVNDTIISGSPLPRSITYQELLLAGMIVPPHIESLRIRVKEIEDKSYLARLDAKITKANQEKAPLENAAFKILQYFIPTVLGIALTSGIIVGCLFNPTMAIQCAAAVLVSACPCTLGFITPLSVKIGLAKAPEMGVQYKSAKALQNTQQMDTVVFDLNGTLTVGFPQVSDYRINIQQGISSVEFFQYLNLLEQQSKHPIAASILDFIRQRNTPPMANTQLTDINTSHHAGIVARIKQDILIVGNAEMMSNNQINMDAYQTLQKENGHVIYLAKNGVILGYVVLQDQLRPGARETIDELKRMGKKIYICTGATQETANYYAEMLNIPQDQVYGNCTGSDIEPNSRNKVQVIKHLQQEGKKVAMIGDASNDALALSTADLGIAVKSNAADEMSQQEADVIIPNTSLQPVINAFKLSQQTVSNIKQNLIMSLTYNSAMLLVAGGLFVAMGFVLNPGLGVALMVLQTSLVLLNQYRFRQQKIDNNNTPSMATENPLDLTYRQFNQSNLATNQLNTQPEPKPSQLITLPSADITSIETNFPPITSIPTPNLVRPRI